MIRLRTDNAVAEHLLNQPALAAAIASRSEPVPTPVLRDSLLEDGDADAGVAIRLAETGRYEYVHWSRGEHAVVLSTADERAVALAFVESLCPLDRLVAAIGEPEGFSLRPTAQGFLVVARGDCEVDFPRGSSTIFACVRLMNLIATPDELLVRCIEQQWAAPVFGALDDVLGEVRRALAGRDGHSYDAWRGWWETTRRHDAKGSV